MAIGTTANETLVIFFGVEHFGKDSLFFNHFGFSDELENCESTPCIDPSSYFSQINALDYFKTILDKHLDPNITLNDTASYRPTFYQELDISFLSDHLSKLTILVPIYFAVIVTWTYLYFKRLRLAGFKPSPISRFVWNYALVKVIIWIFYLGFLSSVGHSGLRNSGSRVAAALFSFANYLLNISSVGLVVLFAQGYYTEFFTFTGRRPVVVNTALISCLYAVQTLSDLLYTIEAIAGTRYLDFEDNHQSLTTVLSVLSAVLYVITFAATSFLYYRTYRRNGKDQRFYEAGLTILVAYLMSNFIVIPEDPRDLWYSIRNKILFRAYMPMDAKFGYKAPELVELAVMTMVIYIWRDDVKSKDDGGYELVDQS